MDAGKTNISFNNKITESDSVNLFENEYLYNGSGVGIGDFNNDGLSDIFFCGSMVSSKLYINKGNFKFEDITKKAGIETSKWCTGVSIVDINNDGYLDIYICSSHSPDKEKRKNLLFINDGKLHFSEQAALYGLADTGFSTQAAFLDYDKDGDLDMYLLNHRLYKLNTNDLAAKDTSGNSPASDRLYRNNGIREGQSHPLFQDVSKQAGIKEDGYGLGVVITDVNNDHWPDVYVANDYIGNDLLWLNNKDGSFSNTISTSLKHQSYNSMGVDAADINNDCLPDLTVVDMMPEDNKRKKMMFNALGQEKFDMQERLGYEPAFVRNMLQLHNGLKTHNDKYQPFYSEIAQLAGISETDWSWSVLMADFDNDTWKDIHITNGLAKDVTNNDYAAFRNSQDQNDYTFGNSAATRKLDKKTIQLYREYIDQYGSIKINNYFFHNSGNLTFKNTTKQSGLAIPSVSNGAAYSDLDNDGDLDLVVNNMNQEAFIWKNEIRQSATDSNHNFISIKLKGPSLNGAGLGSKIFLYNKGTSQYLEQSPVRGFSSGVDVRLHFGVGNLLTIDSLKIVWPDNKIQLLSQVKSNQYIILEYANAGAVADFEILPTSFPFTEVSKELHLQFDRTEFYFYDFGYQRMLPQKYSQLGPALATGDMNGDGYTDLFVGGASRESGKILLQSSNGTFTSRDLIREGKMEEDLGAVLFDADNDQDLDLLITGGSLEFGRDTVYNKPKLYTNDGNAHFTINELALPPHIATIAQAVCTGDYDNDGDMDIFIGGRIKANEYPLSPRSYLLQNNKGIFKEVTKEVSSLLEYPGLVTAAVWTDFDNDKKEDLVLTGEWMPVRFFKNVNNKLEEITQVTGMNNMNGQWRALQAADLDNDGDIDFIAGNIGLNNKFNVSAQKPLMAYSKDIDRNGQLDFLMAYHIRNDKGEFELFPAADRNQLAEMIPLIKKKYLMHEEFSKVNMKKLLSDFGEKEFLEVKCETTTSMWIENKGNGKFHHHELPIEAQFAPINSIVATDVDNDGKVDLLLAGNEYQVEVSTGRYDASYGVFLKGNGKGSFTNIPAAKTGFILEGDVKNMRILMSRNSKHVVVAANNKKLKCFKYK